jgi:nicotinamidase-related amidase
MTSALLIIDVQHALCAGKWSCFDIERVVDRINVAAEKARSAGAPVIFIQHEDDGPLTNGGVGWQLDARLVVRPDDLRLRKTASDAFQKTDLHSLLQARGVDRLIICGLQSDFCVDSTTRRALSLGYPVALLSDGHSTMDNGVLKAAQISAHHTETLSNLTSYGPRVTPVTAADLRVELAD